MSNSPILKFSGYKKVSAEFSNGWSEPSLLTVDHANLIPLTIQSGFSIPEGFITGTPRFKLAYGTSTHELIELRNELTLLKMVLKTKAGRSIEERAVAIPLQGGVELIAVRGVEAATSWQHNELVLL
ncbi:hypothetical protein OUZ56_033793 [Daphnia magna]|uniref:Phage tail protein n=1 Tax=Daphnia magna TaxID=35525 RepID=A0ABR0BB41_9CRUS|nr:hypothetical protein OUZ56_033793 [Daphnia magna]